MKITSSCRVCGAGETSREIHVRGYRLATCAACGYSQVVDVPPLQELAEMYGAQYFSKQKYRNDEANAREQRRRLSFVTVSGCKRAGRLLDFGCATGDFLRLAKGRFEAYGADVSSPAIETAKGLQPDLADRLFVSDTAASLPEDVRDLDVVTAWDVIEHVGYPVDMLRRLAGRLAPDGIVAISTPNAGALTARLMGARWAFMTPPEHLGFFDPDVLAHAFAQAGLRMEGWMSKGKWANVGFVLYKAARVFPDLLAQGLVERVGTSRLGRVCIYVPTGDVLYAIGRRTS
jgi:2-polyprenyl-3-methyl-5-hydroxy-6-metoxy-1,4-benzoquinol methylase